MAKLNTQQRNSLAKSQFAIPSKAPGSGSYPINDKSHARAALSRVAANGTPAEKKKVRSAVATKYPNMNVSGLDSAMSAHADSEHPTRGRK